MIDLGPDDEILSPAYYCGSEVDPLVRSGARLVVYRVDESCRIDTHDLKRRITGRTKAIYITHYFGFPQDILPVLEICRRYKIYLIEDCALSLFSHNGDGKVGSFGDLSVFSFMKTLPVPDGGALVINNPVLYGKAKSTVPPPALKVAKQLLPLVKSDFLQYLSARPRLKTLHRSLYGALNRHHLSEMIQSAGVTGPEKPDIGKGMYYREELTGMAMSKTTENMLRTFDADEILGRRRKNYSLLYSRLAGCQGLEILFKDLPPGVCPLNFPVIVQNRDKIQLGLYKLGIDAGAFWKGYHNRIPLNGFREACYLKDNVLTLPIHQGLTDEHMNYVADCVTEVLNW